MKKALDPNSLKQAFTEARTFDKFKDEEISDDIIAKIYDLMKWGPTAMNCQPGHYVFIKSKEAKNRLKPTLMKGNTEKTMLAPVTVIVASDTKFYNNLPIQFPAYPDAKSMFENNKEMSKWTAFRNCSLQGAYLILAARMLGLDCGPMSGFNNDTLDAEFFPEGRYKSNFLINIGIGDPSGNYPRGSRLQFDAAVEIL